MGLVCFEACLGPYSTLSVVDLWALGSVFFHRAYCEDLVLEDVVQWLIEDRVLDCSLEYIFADALVFV